MMVPKFKAIKNVLLIPVVVMSRIGGRNSFQLTAGNILLPNPQVIAVPDESKVVGGQLASDYILII